MLWLRSPPLVILLCNWSLRVVITWLGLPIHFSTSLFHYYMTCIGFWLRCVCVLVELVVFLIFTTTALTPQDQSVRTKVTVCVLMCSLPCSTVPCKEGPRYVSKSGLIFKHWSECGVIHYTTACLTTCGIYTLNQPCFSWTVVLSVPTVSESLGYTITTTSYPLASWCGVCTPGVCVAEEVGRTGPLILP